MSESPVQNQSSTMQYTQASSPQAPAGLPVRWVVILSLAAAVGVIAFAAGAPVWTAITAGLGVTASAHKFIGT